MSKGKYSPTVFARDYSKNAEYDRNAKGEVPAEWNAKYDEEIMCGNYDSQGFDSYGYSGYLADGTYVGCGNGVDRNGYTEMDYQSMSDEEFEQF